MTKRLSMEQMIRVSGYLIQPLKIFEGAGFFLRVGAPAKTRPFQPGTDVRARLWGVKGDSRSNSLRDRVASDHRGIPPSIRLSWPSASQHGFAAGN